MRDLRKLTEKEVEMVKQMGHDHPAYDAVMAMYDCTLNGEVSHIGYTAQNFFLDILDKIEIFFINSQFGEASTVDSFKISWNYLSKELDEYTDEKEKTASYHQQALKINAAVFAANSVLLDYAEAQHYRDGNKNLMKYLASQYPDAAGLKKVMKAVITPQQEQQLKAYIDRACSNDMLLIVDDYYDELNPDNPTDERDAMPSWWCVADDKREVFAKHLLQMLDEGVFCRRFHLPIGNRKAFINDIEIFFNLKEGELQKLID